MTSLRVILLLFLFLNLLFANAVFIQWKTEPKEDKILLQWKTSQEDNVQKFVIQRSNDNTHFKYIGEVKAQGPGFQYEFIDDSLGKFRSLFYYRLQVVNNDGSVQYTESKHGFINISSIIRTWGSIKALFE